MQDLYLIIPSFFAGLSFSCVGFGNALIFMFFWFSFDQLSLLHKSNALKDAVFMSCIISLSSASTFAIQHLKSIRSKLVLYMSFFGIFGVISGIETLRVVGENAWVKRGLGAIFFISFILQFQSSNQKLREASLSNKKDLIGLAFGCTGAGFLGGLFGAYGPPLIIVILVRNFSKSTFQPSLSAFVIMFSSVQLIYNIFIWKSTKQDLQYCYLSSASSAIFGIFIGHFLQPYISQFVFRRLLQSILFVASLSIMSYKMSFSLWITLSSIVLVIAVNLYPLLDSSKVQNTLKSRGTSLFLFSSPPARQSDNESSFEECKQQDNPTEMHDDVL